MGLRLQAFAADQLRQAAELLAQTGERRHAGVHHARKCIRRSKAALALAADTLDRRGHALADELGRICRGLSALRDSQALIEALQRIAGEETSDADQVLADALALARERRDEVLRRALMRDPEMAVRRRRLLAAQRRLVHLDWSTIEARDVSEALMRSQRRLDKALRRARKHSERDEAWHVYRRRLRRLRQQDTLLAEVWPALRPAIEDLESQARILGESQDDVLILKRCGGRSPFTREQRALLRKIARERLRNARA